MKVVAFNGSPNKEGNTYHAIKMVAKELEKENINVEIVHVGNKLIRGCMACGACKKNRDEKCVINDEVNEYVQKMKDADGILISSPVYFASMAGTMKSFLDRAFLISAANGNLFRHKVGASVVAVRRSGGLPTFNQLNNYLNFAEMIMPNSNYWNVIHGKLPGDALKDEEGTQIMRVLGRNMAHLLNLVEHGKNSVKKPEKEPKIYVNFME